MKKENLARLNMPDTPGVYLFRGSRGKILYVGKATSLRDRVRSYFVNSLADARSAAIGRMVDEAHTVTWYETGSVLEALMLEASLIKKYQPPYNIREKDNKSFNYVVITKEEYPRVLPVRGRELFTTWEEGTIKHIFGPFPQGSTLKEALKIIRKIFPYRDTCIPCSHGEEGGPDFDVLRNASALTPASRAAGSVLGHKIRTTFLPTACKPCFNRQIGLCPGVCTGEVNANEYGRAVKHIAQLFSGNFKGLKRTLARDMKSASAQERFEEAAQLRGQITALEHIRDVSLIKDERLVSAGGSMRVEAFDTAHTAGTETVAVMTVVENGEAARSEYRKFKIQTVTNDDVAALREALSRRLTHVEWPLPRVFVVDGGTAQVRAAERVLQEAGVGIPIVGVVKNEYHKPERLIGDARARQLYEREILLANAEAHRFAIQWHRVRLRKRML